MVIIEYIFKLGKCLDIIYYRVIYQYIILNNNNIVTI